ncbi:MAG: DUF2125 domain-containing protein [Acetobacterales bacterium]
MDLSALRGPFGMVLTAIAVAFFYVILWFYLAGQAARVIEDWAALQRAQGQMAELETRVSGGFPLHIRVAIDEPRLGGRTGAVSWAWVPPPVTVEVGLFNWSRATFRTSGEHQISAIFAGEQYGYEGTIENLVVELGLESGRKGVDDVYVYAENASLNGRGDLPWSAASLEVDLQRPAPDPEDKLAASMRLRVQGRDMVVPPLEATPLGPRMRLLDLSATLKGRIEGRRLIQALHQWTAAGGVLDVERINTVWGPLGLSGNATLALDQELQPEGALGARMTGLFRALDAFADAGWLTVSTASFAKVVLGSLARPNPEGGSPILDIAITVQDRTLHVGKVKIGTLPRIEWDSPLSSLLGFYYAPADGARPRE